VFFNGQEQGVDTDPLMDYLTKGEDAFVGWVGRDHFLASWAKGRKEISWVITRKNDLEVTDNWSFPGKMDDILAIIGGWEPRCAATLAKAPSCIDWKQIFHDPLPAWICESARVVLIGDVAHPFFPTSMHGGSQAIEDGVVLAVALQVAGKDNLPLAIQAWKKIRYLRVRESQLIGEDVRNRWHRWQPGDRGPMLDVPRLEWLFVFDADADAYNAFEGVARDTRENEYSRPVLPPELAP